MLRENPLPRYDVYAWVPDEWEDEDVFVAMVEIYYLEPVFSILRMQYHRDRWLPDSEWVPYLQVTSRMQRQLEFVLEGFIEGMRSWMEAHYDRYWIDYQEREAEYYGQEETDKTSALLTVLQTKKLAGEDVGLDAEDDIPTPVLIEAFVDWEYDIFDAATGRLLEEFGPDVAVWFRLPEDWLRLVENSRLPAALNRGREHRVWNVIADALDFGPLIWAGFEDVRYSNEGLHNYFESEFYSEIQQQMAEDAYEMVDEDEFKAEYYGGEHWDEVAAQFGGEILDTRELLEDESENADDWVAKALIKFHYLKTLEHHGGSLFEYMDLSDEHLSFLSELGDEAFELAERMRLPLPVGVSA